jgi:hypothetical protein
MRHTGLRRAATTVGILIGLFGLIVDFTVIVPPSLAGSELRAGRGPVDALLWFFTYFTHLSNLGLVLVYSAELSGWRGLRWFADPKTRVAMGGYILLVMLYYHFMLSGLYVMTGWLQVGTVILHYVAPLYYLAWWALVTPHGSLRHTQIGVMLVPGLAYVAWVLLRGLVAGEYPYAILDAGRFGYLHVATGVGTLLIAVCIFCAGLVSADRLLGRAAATLAT